MKKTGILLPIFSLPNKYGIGTIGKQAYKFIDFLSVAKQDFWQILPANPTTYGDSPYQSFSSFAYNPYFIDLELLVMDGLLTKDELLNSSLENDTSYIDYGNIFINKVALLKKTYQRRSKFSSNFSYFKKTNPWVDDYAVFMVLKEKFNYAPWWEWDNKFKYKEKEAIDLFIKENNEAIETIKFIQFLYHKQWKELLHYAHKHNVSIIGDMPIYVAYDSVDVWANSKLFLLDEKYNPTMVAGVPPDYFSSKGQLWGNPLYDYQEMEKDNYKWFVERVRHNLKQVDYLRIDHFRGFSAFYAIPFGSEDAINGKWIKGPGISLFNQINKELNNPHIIAENLGLLDDDVYKLIDDCGYPGMRILQFEMYSKENLTNLKLADANNIVYPGTHDNNTFVSWFADEASETEKENVIKELGVKDIKLLNNYLIKYCYKFPFDYAIISMQDVLGLTHESRMNCPGSNSNNWQFMFSKKHFDLSVARKLASYKSKFIK